VDSPRQDHEKADLGILEKLARGLKNVNRNLICSNGIADEEN
jgi:hypothetical protein